MNMGVRGLSAHDVRYEKMASKLQVLRRRAKRGLGGARKGSWQGRGVLLNTVPNAGELVREVLAAGVGGVEVRLNLRTEFGSVSARTWRA